MSDLSEQFRRIASECRDMKESADLWNKAADALEAKDAEIMQLTCVVQNYRLGGAWKGSDRDELIEKVERLTDENRKLRAQRESSIEYSCNLQRMIERHCCGQLIDDDLSKKSPHLASKINASIRALSPASTEQEKADGL